MRALALAAAANQITVIVTDSLLFAPLRRAASERSGYAGKLLSCHLCFGTWVGLMLALVFRPGWTAFGGHTRGGATAGTQLLGTIADGFAIAFLGRALHVITSKMWREARVLDETAELLDEEAYEGPASVRDGEPIAKAQ